MIEIAYIFFVFLLLALNGSFDIFLITCISHIEKKSVFKKSHKNVRHVGVARKRKKGDSKKSYFPFLLSVGKHTYKLNITRERERGRE